MDREGASDLVAELVMKSSLSPNVFMEAVQLGIALLEGGNPVIQRSLFSKLQSAETSQTFFKVRSSLLRGLWTPLWTPTRRTQNRKNTGVDRADVPGVPR